MMNAFSFSIAAWRAVSHKMTTTEDWQSWAVHPHYADALPEYKPALAFLPPLQRRRLGVAARLLFDAAWPLLAGNQHCPMVFASHDGEINRSFELWLSLLRDNEMSPTSFGLSVHNAQIGQWSMLRGDMSESTALCAAEDGFETAFAEAYALLCEGARQVLVLVADEPLKTQYPVMAVRAPMSYAAAFMVTAGDDWRLTQGRARFAAGHGASPYWGALNWLRAHYLGCRDFTQTYRSRSWQWQHA